MAKLQYTRFEDIFRSRDIAIKKLDDTSRNFAEPVMIRYYGESDRKVKTLVALYRSNISGDYVLQYDEERDGTVYDLEDLINQMLDFNKPLVSPVIKGTWNYYSNSGIPLVINNPTPDSKNPSIERGYKARFNGIYTWNSELGKKNPIKVTSDSSWLDLPKSGTSSSAYNSDLFTRDTKILAGIQAPKTGLIVVGDSVKLAEGEDDRSYDSRSVTFLERIYYGNAMTNNIGESEIKSLSSSLGSTREKVISNVSTSTEEYFIYAYPKLLGALSQIIQNYSYPILEAFSRKEITIINGAGLDVDLYVYISNNPGAFTNVELQFK